MRHAHVPPILDVASDCSDLFPPLRRRFYIDLSDWIDIISLKIISPSFPLLRITSVVSLASPSV